MTAPHPTSRPAPKIGLGAALLLAVEAIVFGISLLIPTATHLSYISSIFIPPSFIALMVAIHHTTPPHKQVWSHIGIAFAAIYAVMCASCYYLQLTVIRVNDLNLSPEILQAFAFTPGSLVFAQDMLGYTFLCLATLVTAPVFSGSRLAHWIKWLFVAHGLMFIVPFIFPALSFAQDASSGDEIGVLANLLWCAVFAPIAILLAIYFKRMKTQ